MSELLEQVRTWKEARARLDAGKPSNVLHIVPPTTDPTRDVMDKYIAAVGNTAQIPATDILNGVAHPEIAAARRLAMAICVRFACIPLPEIAEYFGVHVEAINGAVPGLNKIMAEMAVSTRTPIELSLPAIWRETVERMPPWRPMIRDVQLAICKAWGITIQEMVGPSHSGRYIIPRHAAMALAAKLCAASMSQIGRHFGDRNHTTVLFAREKMRPVLDAASANVTPLSTLDDWIEAVKVEIAAGKVRHDPWGKGKKYADLRRAQKADSQTNRN